LSAVAEVLTLPLSGESLTPVSRRASSGVLTTIAPVPRVPDRGGVRISIVLARLCSGILTAFEGECGDWEVRDSQGIVEAEGGGEGGRTRGLSAESRIWRVFSDRCIVEARRRTKRSHGFKSNSRTIAVANDNTKSRGLQSPSSAAGSSFLF